MFFLALLQPLSTLNTLDQTVIVCISPPHFPYQDDPDFVLSDTDTDSEEDITILSYGPAPGPSGSTRARAIPQHGASDSDVIVISDGKSESDAGSEDVVVSTIPPSLSKYFSHCQQTKKPDAGHIATDVKPEDSTRQLGKEPDAGQPAGVKDTNMEH